MDNFAIASKIKTISFADAMGDLARFSSLDFNNTTTINNCGMKYLDFHTLPERIKVISKRGINFIQFLDNWEIYKNVPYVQKQIAYYIQTNSKKNEIQIKYCIYKLYWGCITSFRPFCGVQLLNGLSKRVKTVFDPCAGWGGRALACAVYGCKYIGVDTNKDLSVAYFDMNREINNNFPYSNIDLSICNALEIDYSSLSYDCVFTSPPYYKTEVYPYQETYYSKNDMDTRFYLPLFRKLFDNLETGGYMCINVPDSLYNRVLKPVYGNCHSSFVLNKFSNNRPKQSRVECIYIWQKN